MLFCMKPAQVVGITGGIFGILIGLMVLLFAGLFSPYGNTTSLAIEGWLAIGVSLLAFFATNKMSNNRKWAGWLIIAAGVIGLIATSVYFLMPAALLVGAGVIALQQHRQSSESQR